MANEKLVIKLDLDLDNKDVKKEFKKVEQASKKLGATVTNSSKKAGGLFGSIGASVSSLLGPLGLATIGFAGLTRGISSVINAANQQEDSINKLNSALRISGQFTSQASQELQDYASSLQDVSRFGDETILETQALIQSLGALDKDGLKRATKASLDLASALGIDLRSAATLVGKAASGEIGSFSRYGVIIERGATNAETFTNALTKLETKFGGAAARDVQTVSGQYQQLSNAIGDVAESLGFLITESNGIDGALAKTTRFTKFLQLSIDSLRDSFGDDFEIPKALGPELALAIKDNQAEIDTLQDKIAALREKAAKGGIGSLFTEGAAKRAEKELIEQERISVELQNRKAQLDAEAEENEKTRREKELADIRTQNEAKLAALDELGLLTNEKIISDFEERNIIIQEARDAQLISEEEYNAQVIASDKAFQAQRQSIAEKGLKQRGKVELNFGKALAQNTAKNLSVLTKALIDGEKPFKAFGDFILNTLGDVAIQQGQIAIAQGFAIEALKSVQGGQAIAVGVSLIALGQLAKSFAGGGSGGASAPSPSGSAVDPVFTEDNTNTDQISEEPTAQAGNIINLTVEGNILDRRESASELVSIINEGIVSDNLTINQSFA